MALGVSVLLWTVHKIMFHNICTLPQVIFPSLTLYVCMCVCVKNGMAVYSSILAWRISWSEEPWNCRVGHDWETCTLCHYFKVYGPYHQWDVLFYGLIIGWFWVPNSVATPCSIYLQRKSKCSFFFFFNLCWVQGSPMGEGYHHDTRKQLSPSVAKWPFTCTRVVSCFGMEKLPNFKTHGIGIFKGEDG